jgi:hypothetical protein
MVYQPGSYFNTPIAQTSETVSSTRTAEFIAMMRSHVDQVGVEYPKLRGIDGNMWGTPYAVGRADDPIYTLGGTGNIPAACADLATTGFHAPPWLWKTITGTSDSPLVVLDKATRQTVWLTGVQSVPVGGGVIDFTWASGRFMHDSNGLDRRNPQSNNVANERSRGAIPDAMVIDRKTLERAIRKGRGLKHVLHMFIVESNSDDGAVHPMTGFESNPWRVGFGAEGERLRLNPAIDMTLRTSDPYELAIARTLQDYGCYIGDNSGSGTALKMEQATVHRDPWVGTGLNQHSLNFTTWDDWQVMAP